MILLILFLGSLSSCWILCCVTVTIHMISKLTWYLMVINLLLLKENMYYYFAAKDCPHIAFYVKWDLVKKGSIICGLSINLTLSVIWLVALVICGQTSNCLIIQISWNQNGCNLNRNDYGYMIQKIKYGMMSRGKSYLFINIFYFN